MKRSRTLSACLLLTALGSVTALGSCTAVVSANRGASTARAVRSGGSGDAARPAGTHGPPARLAATWNPSRRATTAATVAPARATPTPSAQPLGEPVDCAVLKCIALTFDDGPGPYTRKLVKELSSRHINATFFLIGEHVAARPGSVRATVKAGNIIGNHTWSHPQLPLLTRKQIDWQIAHTATAIETATGLTTTLMRPPYGATDAKVGEVAAADGYAQIIWDVDTRDWANRNAHQTSLNALQGAHRNAIILMHDIYPSTVEAAPRIAHALRKRGYTLVTIPQLLGTQLTPGEIYYGSEPPLKPQAVHAH